MGQGKVIAFGGFLFGYDIGVISGCLIMPDFQQRFGEAVPGGGYILSPVRQSEITSLLSAGTFVGALAQAFTADSMGRKGSVLFWSVIFTIGVTIQTATVTSLPQLLFGRFAAGLGVGALSALVPMYNGETAPKHLRGTLLVLYQLMIIGGIFLSYIIDLGTHAIPGSASWRIPVGLQMLWGMILVVGITFLPESPRHLIFKEKISEARAAIAELNSTSTDSALVDEIMQELTEGVRAENEGGKATWMECFSPEVRMRTINGMMLQFLQQLNGQNFYYYYGDTCGLLLSLSSYGIQAILGGVSFITIWPALYLIETMGRRTSLLLGAIMEGVCALIAGLVGHFMLAPTGTPTADLTKSELAGGQTLIAFAVLHVASFSLLWGPVPWVYLGESFPLRVRAKCIALGAATNWLWNFLLAYFSPRIAADIGPLILLIFAGMLAVAYVYVPWNSATWQPSQGTTRKRAFERTYYNAEWEGTTAKPNQTAEEKLNASHDTHMIEHKRDMA
ncbi:hypothetical protein RQP46_009662 [Phenoliferia psychrophenolica]